MLGRATIGDQDGPAPCPGLFDDGGAIRDLCRTCGKCDDLIGALTRDIVAGTAGANQTRRSASGADTMGRTSR